MHVRISTKRDRGKTYRYTQIVQSYRRKDGMPATRVLGNLGEQPERTVENLKLALRASREGKAIVIAPDTPGLSDESKVLANLQYLDVAVMLEMWRHWGLRDRLEGLLPRTESAAPASDVTAALVLQRCVAPGSKLYAQRWLPTTALPELLGLTAEQFNNTRVHRVLDDLHLAGPALQERLAMMYEGQEGASSAFFIDVTDTFFEGRGCELAQRNRTKAGHRNKWSIGIVLLANELGYPVRWQVIPSKMKDHLAMGEMVDRLAGLEWIRRAPLVCDRAMGRDSSLRRLLGSGLRFLTAAPVNTVETYTNTLPHHVFSMVTIEGTEEARERDTLRVAQAARDIGLEEVDPHLFVLDLGVVDLDAPAPSVDVGQPERGKAQAALGSRSLTADVWTARYLQAGLQRGEWTTQRAAGEAVGLSQPKVSQLLGLLHLASSIQRRLLSSPRSVHVSLRQLRQALQDTDPGRQQEVLCEGLMAPQPNDARRSSCRAPRQESVSEDVAQAPDHQPRLRLLAYFNPQMFVDKRCRARKHLDEIGEFVEDLNRELAQAARSRKQEPTRRKIVRKLERYGYFDAFDVTLTPITVQTQAGAEIASFRCHVTLRPEEWKRRRRYDGFVLLLGHAALPHSAIKLAELYREKDVIEKDFQTIKSVVKLRPVYHHTDPKVQAHVTVCMLALLLQRTLEQRLRDAKVTLTAPACQEILHPCHLNLMKRQAARHNLYSVTEPTTAQREILAALGLSRLGADDAVARSLTPRLVSTQKLETGFIRGFVL